MSIYILIVVMNYEYVCLTLCIFLVFEKRICIYFNIEYVVYGRKLYDIDNLYIMDRLG